jgi:hypothetical protein
MRSGRELLTSCYSSFTAIVPTGLLGVKKHAPVRPMNIRNVSRLLSLIGLGLSWAAQAEFRPAVARVTLDRSLVEPSGRVQAEYVFRCNGPAPNDFEVFVHVVRPDGRHLGADFAPAQPTSEWPNQGFVREHACPILVPTDAVPGRYAIWVGLYSSTSGERIDLDNPDRLRGTREYEVGEFEVVAVGGAPATKPATFNWLSVDETALVQTARAPIQAGAKPIERLVVTLDRSVLNPVLEKGASAKVTVSGFNADGARRILRPPEVTIRARTRNASGNVAVVAVEGTRVMAREGGIATVEAELVQGGSRLTASADVVVRPFYRDYHQTLVLKLFLGMEGEPVERLANEPMFRKPHDVLCTFAEALDVIRRTDNLTRGIPKIVYLVGWQQGGHDHLYPAWSVVNSRLKRPEDATALESLRWLIREARRFHTTVSLHINMVDAYKSSPVWDEYAAQDCLARQANGELLTTGIAMKGQEMYNVVYPREWAAGLAQQRIDGLIRMIPELRDGHTIHVDVFIAQRENGQPISPWHARPENGGLTPDKYVATQRLIFKYWRERGFDVTGEGIFWAHPPGEGFTGLQAMSWWYPNDFGYQLRVPECLMARGRTDRGGDGDFRFASSMHGEEIFIQDKATLPGFLGMFCRTTLPWQYLSRRDRVKLERDVLYYSGGVRAGVEGGKKVIRKGEFMLREDDDLFVPALWHKREIIAYSRTGYAQRTWRLPADWRGVRRVDVYRIAQEGLDRCRTKVPVVGGTIALTLGQDEALTIVPSGSRP